MWINWRWQATERGRRTATATATVCKCLLMLSLYNTTKWRTSRCSVLMKMMRSWRLKMKYEEGDVAVVSQWQQAARTTRLAIKVQATDMNFLLSQSGSAVLCGERMNDNQERWGFAPNGGCWGPFHCPSALCRWLTLAHSVRPCCPSGNTYYLWLFIGHDHDHHLHFIISRCREIYIHNSLLWLLLVVVPRALMMNRGRVINLLIKRRDSRGRHLCPVLLLLL